MAFRRSRKPRDTRTKEEKILGEDCCREMERMGAEELTGIIAQSTETIITEKAKLDAHEPYKKAKSDVKLLSSGFNEVKKRLNVKIAYALKLKEAQGKA